MSPEPERLSIAHLLVWTALSAVLLGVDRATSQLPHVEPSSFGRLISFIYAPLFGAGVSALLLTAWRLATDGPRFPAQPGHWLLVISGVQSLLHLGTFLIQAVVQAGFGWELLLAGRFVEELTCGTLFVLAIRESHRLWRITFVAGLIGYCLGLLLTVGACFKLFHPENLHVEFVIHWIVLTVCAFAVADDWATHNSRDYLHWTGLVVRFTYLSLVAAIPYLLRYVQAE
jgi:hypothetical protein